MPITRNSDDYLDLIQQDILDHYRITLPKATIKTVLDQFQQSIHHHLNQANQIDLSPFLTIHPSLTFEEVVPAVIDFDALAPAVPVEAEFEEMVIDLGRLAPAIPAEADFSDASDQMIDISSLAPVTPIVADFE